MSVFKIKVSIACIILSLSTPALAEPITTNDGKLANQSNKSIAKKTNSDTADIKNTIKTQAKVIKEVIKKGATNKSIDKNHYAISTSIEKIAELVSKKKWQRAYQHAEQSANPDFAVSVLTALRIYYEPNDFSAAKLNKFFSMNSWIPLDALALGIERSMGLGRDKEEILEWFKYNEPRSNYGMLMNLYANEAALDRATFSEKLKALWVNTKLDQEVDEYFLNQYADILKDVEINQKVLFYTWNENYKSATKLINKLPIHIANQARTRIALAQDPSYLHDILDKQRDLSAQDEFVQYQAIKYLIDHDHIEPATWLIEKVESSVNPVKWYSARNLLSRYAVGELNYRLAYDIISNHGMQDGAEFVEAEFFAGWLALRYLGRGDLAKMHFQNMYDHASFATSKSKASYWLCMYYKNIGDVENMELYRDIAASYPGTFYGHLAIAMKYGNAKVDYFHKLADPNLEASEMDVKKLAIFIGAIKKANINQLSSKLLSHMGEYNTDSKTLNTAIKYFKAKNLHNLAIEFSAIANNKNGFLFKDGYPTVLPIDSHVKNKAIYLGIIRQESNFDQNAVSNRGAKGLMQLMPATAAMMAKKLNLPANGYAKSAKHNLLKGMAFFSGILNDFDDSYILAICSYNAGPGNVRKWIDKYGDPRGKDIEFVIDWIEKIPFVQTRLYVKKVLENIVIYDSISSDSHNASTIYNFLLTS